MAKRGNMLHEIEGQKMDLQSQRTQRTPETYSNFPSIQIAKHRDLESFVVEMKHN